jgi:hypothetical protein
MSLQKTNFEDDDKNFLVDKMKKLSKERLQFKKSRGYD